MGKTLSCGPKGDTVNRRVPILVVGFLLAANAALCATAKEKEIAFVKRRVKKTSDGFYTVEYAKYVIKTDIDAQFAVEAAVYMREFRKAFRSFFKPKPKLKATPTVYFFKDRATYQEEMKKRGHAGLANAAGGYAGDRKRSHLYCFHDNPGAGFGGINKEVIRHEGAHQLLSYILGRHDIPIWFNEGVATFFESWDIEKPREQNIEKLKKFHTRFARIRRTFGTDAFRDLHYLVRLNRKTWVSDNSRDGTLQHYAEVQSFMTFLLVNPKGREFFGHIFRAVARGKDALKMLTPKAINGAQKAWYKDIGARMGKTGGADGAGKKARPR